MTTPTAVPTPLAYDDSGDGPAVVLIHGLTFSRATWRPVTDRLSARFRCVSVDLPAHGDSGGPPLPLDQAADAVASAVDALGVQRPVVVGHSMGAMIALIYAARHAVDGLVTVDQPLYVRPFGELLGRLAPALRGAGFAEAFEPIRRSIGVDDLPEPMRSEIAATQVVSQDVVVGYWAELLDGRVDDVQGWVDTVSDALAAPYLAIFGHDLPAEQRDYLRTHVPHAQVEEWPGTGHMAHVAALDRFVERLTAFVDAASAES